MTTREMLEQVLSELPEDRVKEVLDFARSLNSQEDREAWVALGCQQLAKAYVDDEPEDTEADIKPEQSEEERLLHPSAHDEKPRLISDDGNGLRPGVCLDNSAALLDIMEKRNGNPR